MEFKYNLEDRVQIDMGQFISNVSGNDFSYIRDWIAQNYNKVLYIAGREDRGGDPMYQLSCLPQRGTADPWFMENELMLAKSETVYGSSFPAYHIIDTPNENIVRVSIFKTDMSRTQFIIDKQVNSREIWRAINILQIDFK